MKSKEVILASMLAVLAELQHRNDLTESLEATLVAKLEVYYDILEDDVPEEYREQVEEVIYE